MTGSPTILLIADAGPLIGGGHVMRSLTLARALEKAGARCAFLATPEVETVLKAFAQDVERRAEAGDFDAVVFDHYGLGREDHERIAGGRPALVIDDLANRRLGGDIVLDSGPARLAGDYLGLIGDEAELLLGPRHALVREAFQRRARDRSGPVRRVLIALGLTDVGGVTVKVMDTLTPSLTGVEIDVVVGGGAPSLGELRHRAGRAPHFHLHVDTPDMADLAAAADIAVGAAGSSSFERCVLGLPSVMLVLAENQREAAEALDAAGAAIAAGTVEELKPAFDRLKADDALRVRMGAAATALCDGQGAGRVVEAFLALIAARGVPPQ